jgi:hypothetical protein
MLKKDLPKTAIKGNVDDIYIGDIDTNFEKEFKCYVDGEEEGFTFSTDDKTWSITRAGADEPQEKGWVRDINKAKSAVIYDCRVGDMHRHESDPQVLFVYYPELEEFIIDRPKWSN